MTLQNDLLKHQIFILRLTKNFSKPLLNALIIFKKSAIENKNTKNILEKAISPTINKLNELAVYESQFFSRLTRRYDKRLNPIKKFDKLIENSKVSFSIKSNRVSVKKALKIFVRNKENELKRIKKDSKVVNSDPYEDIVNLVDGKIKTQVISLIKTLISHTANVARQETIRMNKNE